ncbi:hypothetical protein PRIPAC_82622 [Pristionchus pacificus]|uniref:Kynureninase n=1 Tax=Pristionchus pacificus TaxID=54126 RepID=A0A2A6CK34_PRIPA|nr:hypothetical protein PRIPAC_82622 [Pristionchus pacificus]|eukprot:PDM78466.1 hypothetical protein PRIPAC_31045 [Pristionchus pacificus]
MSSGDSAFNIDTWLQQEVAEIGVPDASHASLAAHLHAKDNLATLRDKFEYPKNATLPDVDLSIVNPQDDSIYLCGNSLGLMPKATRRIMNEQLDKWGQMGVFGHLTQPIPWAHGDECAIEGVAALVGANPVEVALMNGLTVNIHILLTAFYTPTPTRHKILLESRAFPSDHYAIESQLRLKGLDPATSMLCMSPRDGEETLRTEDILKTIEEQGDSIAVVFFSGIQYFTGQLFDIEKITRAGQAKGCFVGWDLAHAFANVPLKLHEWNVDFACWCSYKVSCMVARVPEVSRGLSFMKVLDLDEGAAGYRISNPPVHLVVPVMGFLETIDNVNLEDLRKRSYRLTGYLEYLIEYVQGKECPRSASCLPIYGKMVMVQNGFNVSIDYIYKELVMRGVAVDKRYPYIIRVAPVHLYNSFIDIRRFVDVLIESVSIVEEKL